MREIDSWITKEILAVCLIEELMRRGSCDTNLLKEVVGSLKKDNPYRSALENIVKQKGFTQGLSMLDGTGNPL